MSKIYQSIEKAASIQLTAVIKSADRGGVCPASRSEKIAQGPFDKVRRMS